jgi:ribosomal protein L18E
VIQGMSEIDQIMKLRANRVGVDGALTVRASKFSVTARQKIESAGGRVEETGGAKSG